MAQSEHVTGPTVPIEDIQREWNDLTLRVAQLETRCAALEQENRTARTLLERVIEHRQKSHAELVSLLTTLVSKLPINDIGVVISRLVEHNAHVTEVSSGLTKGKLDEGLLQPTVLKALDKTKRDLTAALKTTVEELIQLAPPFEAGILESLIKNPENFYLPAVVRANRGFVKGQIPRERIIKEFGEEALPFFKDVTTDVKFNPRPKPEEIMLAFPNDFETLLQQQPNALPAKRAALLALHQQVRQSRETSEPARAQKNAFLRLSFIFELHHYYLNQATESPDVVFAQRLPPLIEQLAVPGDRDSLDEKLLQQAETLLAFIISPDYRKAVINNLGKAGGLARTLRFTLAFRLEKLSDLDPFTVECVKHLIPIGNPPTPAAIATVLRLMNPHMQLAVIRAIMACDRLRNKEEAQNLGKAVAKELGVPESELRFNEQTQISPERQQQLAWENIKNLIAGRAAPAEIVAAIRKRLHGQYDADEVKLCWLVLTEGDPMIFVRVFCLLPYLPDGQTDPLSRAIMETFATRLTHEKYVAVYTKVINALKNMFKVKADSPALVNFVTLVKWVDADAAAKIAKDIGLTTG